MAGSGGRAPSQHAPPTHPHCERLSGSSALVTTTTKLCTQRHVQKGL